MRYGNRTRGSRRSDDSEGISLFPFLAVLICAAGLLIVLLVVMGRHARAQGTRLAEAKWAEAQKNSKQQLDDVRWRVGQLQKSLEATRRQLVDARLDLGHLEDHSRRLRDELAGLERDWKQLTSAGVAADQAAVETQFRELSSRIAEMKARIREARDAAMSKQRSYSVVPYEGPHGTRRRPIYLECRGNAVLFQPEGVELRASDFEGPLGPGNPLAAALRAAREYMLRAGQLDPAKSGEPYPLLLVRPLGVHAYYAAREAMSNSETEFGYEMIDADWVLDFGQPNPELARLLREEIEAARVRQARLAESAPSHYRYQRAGTTGRSPQYAVSTGGLVVPYGQGSGEEMDAGDAWEARRRRERAEQAAAAAGTGGLAASRPTGQGGLPGGLDGGPGSVLAGNPGEPRSVGAGGTATNVATSPVVLGGTDGGMGGPSGNPSGESYANAPGGTTAGMAGGTTAGVADRSRYSMTSGVPGVSNGAGERQSMAAGETNTQVAANGAARRLGEWYPGQGNVSGESGPAAAGMTPPRKPPRQKKESLAETRGRDWALPDAAAAATPITQPIHVECHADRVDIVPQRGLAGGRSIPWREQTADSVEEIVKAVQKYTEGWGMAGNGMYWRPILHVYVCPGAEDRYEDLQDLLHDSGLPIERKN